MEPGTEQTQERVNHGAKQVAVGILAALAVLSLILTFMYVAFAALAFLFAIAALAVHRLVHIDEVKRVAATARELGARGPITHTGTVVHMEGRCPSGQSMEEGEAFSVADGRTWPRLCPHAERAIFETIPNMNRNPNPAAAPVHYADADHEFDIDLVDVQEEINAA